MIRTIFILCATTVAAVALFLGIHSKKEVDTKNIFTSDEIAWFGLDFTKAHCIGVFDQGFGVEPATADELRSIWIPEWNSLMATEQNNFDLKSSFRKKYVYYDLNSVNELNAQLNSAELLNFNETKITKETIQEMVRKYSSKEKKDGIGLSFIIENFNKNSKTASLYVTFFDIATKKVLMSEYMIGKPSGFGLRNYWAGAIKDILTRIEFFEYNKWKNKCYSNPMSFNESKITKTLRTLSI
ncbi:MAG: hypothetical protein ACXVPU_08565 [Bacteroidia bacterium]